MEQELIECACGCGTVFPKYDTRGRIRRYYSPGHFVASRNRKEIDEGKLREFHSQYWTASQLAEYFQVSYVTIKRRLKKLQLQRLLGLQVGARNPAWKGGRHKLKSGYIVVYKPDHPHAMLHRGNKRYVYEHILVWEETHGRSLPDGWVVHHINGVRSDNRPENLFALPRKGHHYALRMQTLQKKIRELEAKLRRVKAQQVMSL